ncbi:MAG: hypothetical protein INH37_06910 [Myxococcaceae bacterium]|nr:hypothetical protein [Myxococcaceae bacterium]
MTFRPSGCVTVAAHNAALDADPRNPELWRVWADQLLEALDRLGDWLMEKRWSDFELAEHLGVAAPLVRRGLLLATWNDFGFLSTLTLSAPALARHAWVADVTHVPAARHLVELTVAPARKPTPLPSPEALPLPRSLEVLRWPEPLAPSLVTRLRARSPRLTVG